MGALVTHCLDAESLESWGWRVPFLFGLLIGPVGLWIRRYMGETEAFLEAIREPGERQGLLGVLREYRRSVLVSMGLTVIGTVSFYVVLVNMPTFAHKQLGLPLDEVFMVQMAAVALMTLVIPLAGDSPTGSGGARCCWSRPWPSCSWSIRCSPGSPRRRAWGACC